MHVAGLLTLKANWFDALTSKQREIMTNNDVFINQHSNETAHCANWFVVKDLGFFWSKRLGIKFSRYKDTH